MPIVMGQEGSNGVVAPGVNERTDESDGELTPEESTEYRALALGATYLA